MKRIGWTVAILAIVASAQPARAADWDSAAVRNCTWCHGTSGQGYTVAPRLAGQRPQYVESQIRSFLDHLRNNPFSKQYMWSAVAALGSQGAHDRALYFAAIPPKPASDGDRNLAAKGRTICMEGIPDANIASCYACHCPDAEGVRDIPRLGGLAYFYLKAGFEQWGQGYHSSPDLRCLSWRARRAPMRSRRSYLSFVR